MNARKTLDKLCRMPALLVLALPLAAGSAGAATYNLVAMPFNKTMADGSTVPMWGYALDGAAPVPSVPGPALVVPAGDSSLTINLRNALGGPGAEPVSIVIPGQAAAMAPVKFTDDQGRQRVRSFTAEAAVGATRSYTWNNLRPGTYLYHSGTHPQVQVQMGLYGAMTHDAASGQAYAGVPYDGQTTLLFSEVDPALHAAVANGDYGPGQAVTSTIDYRPRYFLINGESHDAASLTMTVGSPGQTILLRLINAGLQTRAPVLHGLDMSLVAEDGRPYPYARRQYSAFLPALKTVDAIISPAAAASHAFYDRRLATVNPGASGSVAGGMLAFLTVAGSPVDTPVAAGDAYSVAEDGSLTVPAPGVLGNDTNATAASLIGGTSHGNLALNANGSFTYTPDADYHGGDAFTYRATNGALSSNVATVSLTVTPVNDPPVITSTPVTSATVGQPYAYDVNASDPDAGDTLAYALVTAPSWMTINPASGLIGGTPTAAGSLPVTVRASDTGGLFAEQSYSLVVTGSVAVPRMYFSTAANTAVPGIGTPDDADIYAWNSDGSFSRVFDASAYGVPASANVNAMVYRGPNEVYLSFAADNVNLPGLPGVQNEDIVRWNGSGWSLFFDGSDVGLSSGSENIDAFTFLADGSLVVSTSGNVSVPGIAGTNADLLRCVGSFGPTTTCAWSMYFDGSDIGLTTGNENIDGVSVDAAGNLYLSTAGNYAVSSGGNSLSGNSGNVFVCHSPTTGPNSACAGFSLFFSGSGLGNVDAVDLP